MWLKLEQNKNFEQANNKIIWLIKDSLKWGKNCAGGNCFVEFKTRVQETRKMVIEIGEPKLRPWPWKWKRNRVCSEACFKFRNFKIRACLKEPKVLGSWRDVVVGEQQQ